MINFLHLIRPEIIIKESIHHSMTPGAAGSVLVHIGAGNSCRKR